MTPDKASSPPTRAEVEARLIALIEGTADRGEVTSWALQWVAADDPPDMEDAIWEALNALAGADSPTTDRPFLYNREDFAAWLEELRRA